MATPQGRRAGRSSFVRLGLATALVWGLLVAPAAGFGTIRGIGQDAEHEKVTRGAVACAPAQRMQDLPGRCWEPRTLDQLAGTSSGAPLPERVNLDTIATWAPLVLPDATGTFGAVGAPDVESFFADVPHCLAGDWLPTPDDDYPQSRAQARNALRRCHGHLKARFDDGVAAANGLVDPGGRIVPAAVDISDCAFIDFDVFRRGVLGFANDIKDYRDGKTLPRPKLKAIEVALRAVERGVAVAQLSDVLPDPDDATAKCGVIGAVGHVYHGIQDFYAHGNWTDVSDHTRAQGIDNPPGMHRDDRPPVLDMLTADPEVPRALVTACFTFLLDQCEKRIDHDKALGKDKGFSEVTVTGRLPNPMEVANAATPRGRIKSNWRRSVLGAEQESWLSWKDLGRRLIARYGQLRGTQMICAITHDDPVRDCTAGPTIDTQVGPAIITGGQPTEGPSDTGPTQTIGR